MAILKGDREVARRVATHLAGLQCTDGRWGLGTAWGRRPADFRERLPEDAKAWDVATGAEGYVSRVLL